jgi:hypothetical protein
MLTAFERIANGVRRVRMLSGTDSLLRLRVFVANADRLGERECLTEAAGF